MSEDCETPTGWVDEDATPPPSHRQHVFLRDFMGEFVGEALLGGASLALFAGVSVATVYAWKRSPALVLGVGVALAVFLGYGIVEMVKTSRGHNRGHRRSRLATVAMVAVGLAVLWAMYVLTYR